MALVRWDPARELASMEVDRLNHMFSNFYGEGFSRSWVPAVDIYETPQHETIIKAELPDMKREEIGLTFENNVLTITGERKLDEQVARDRFQRLERFYGASAGRSRSRPRSMRPRSPRPTRTAFSRCASRSGKKPSPNRSPSANNSRPEFPGWPAPWAIPNHSEEHS